jgi:hypothetical protein
LPGQKEIAVITDQYEVRVVVGIIRGMNVYLSLGFDIVVFDYSPECALVGRVVYRAYLHA